MEKTILSSSGIPKHIEVRKTSFANDDTAFIEAIPGIVFAVIISYVYLNVGTYMNGALGSELVESYANNDKTGSVDRDIWQNSSANGSYIINLSSPNTAEQLSGTTSKFYIRSTDVDVGIYFNLTVNGINVNVSSSLGSGEGYNQTIASLISGASVQGGNSSITFQWDVNTTDNSVEIRIYGGYYTSNDQRTSLENNTASTLGNLSGNFDSNVNIIKIAITISILLVPIMAIMTLRRFT